MSEPSGALGHDTHGSAPAESTAGAGLAYPPVPQAFLGVWQRTLLEGAGIATDTASAVFWLQTPHWHGDIRLPAPRPDFSGCTALVDCSPTQLQWLASQKGFAGLTEVSTGPIADGSVTLNTISSTSTASAAIFSEAIFCEWHRQVDFQAPRPDRDYGRIVFSEDGATLDEYGVHAQYRETWVRLPDSIGTCGAWRRGAVKAQYADARFGQLLLVAGRCFFYLRDRAVSVPAGKDLPSAAMHAHAPALLDMELSFGRWDGAAECGTITHSTLPWREGAALGLGPDWAPA